MSTIGAPRPQIDPRIARRVVEVRRAEGRKRLRALCATAIAAATAALLTGVAESPLGAVRHVRVTGIAATSPVSADAVASASGISKATPMVHVGTGRAEARIEALPTVASATVTRQWPATVRIAVTLRTPVAEVAGGGGDVAVDRTGRVLGDVPGGAALPRLTLPGVAVPPPSRWLPGAPGPEGPLRGGGSATAGVAGAGGTPPAGVAASPVADQLALAAALPAATGAQAVVLSSDAGGVRATIGATAVVFGSGRELAAEIASLEAVEAATPLGAPGTLDLTAPNRPVLTPSAASTTVSTLPRG